MKQATPIILVVICIALGAFAMFEYQQAEHFSALAAQKDKDAAAARVQMDEDASQLRKLKEQTRTQKIAIDQLETRNKELSNGPAPEASPTAAGAAEAGKGDEAGGFMKGLAKMFNDPKMKDAMRGQQVTMARMMYADLAKALGLSPDVAQQVLGLLGERQADVAGASMAAMDKAGKDMAGVGKDMQAIKAPYDEQLKAVLGEDGFKKLEDYEKSMGDRMALDQIKKQLEAGGGTIDTKQGDSLLAIMREERAKSPEASGLGGRSPGDQMKLLGDEQAISSWIQSQEELNRRVLARARTILNPDQMNAFEAAQKQQFEMQKMGIQMSKQMFKGGK